MPLYDPAFLTERLEATIASINSLDSAFETPDNDTISNSLISWQTIKNVAITFSLTMFTSYLLLFTKKVNHAVGYALLCLATCFVINSVYSFIIDILCSTMQKQDNPVKAFKIYFLTLKNKRYAKAYNAVIPSLRKVDSLSHSTRLPGIVSHGELNRIDGLKDYRTYWKNIFSTFSNYITLSNTNIVSHISNDVVIVEGKTTFLIRKSDGGLSLLSYLMGGLVGVFISCFTLSSSDKRTRNIRKLLIRRDNKWFIAESEFMGAAGLSSVI